MATDQTTPIEHESGDAAFAQDSVEALQQRIAQLEHEVEEQKNNFLRSMADFKNYKRRTESERDDLIRNASAGLILKLLPVVDDFSRAMEHVPAEIANNSWLEGVKQVQRKLDLALESEGLQPIDALGQEFDPNFHEAVMFEEGDEEASNLVVQELQRGYRLGERVLRPTMVKVSK